MVSPEKSDTCYKLSSGIDLVRRWLSSYRDEIVWPLLIFVRRRAETAAVADLLTAAGLRARAIHGGMSRDVRREAQEQLREGSLDVVVCTDAWMAGIDIPCLRGIVIACGGSAPIGLKQRSGRGTRLDDGKPSFTIWDLGARGDRHRARRIKGYRDGGYEMGEIERHSGSDQPTAPADLSGSEADPSLEEMLEPHVAPRAEPEPESEPPPPIWPKVGGPDWCGAPFVTAGWAWVIAVASVFCAVFYAMCGPT